MNTLTKHYLIAALWTSQNEEEFLDDIYDIYDFAEESVENAEKDLNKFKELCDHGKLNPFESMTEGQFGHDFWLTRNGHGAGFWDRGLGKLGDKLTYLCKACGESDCYIGDDGKVYLT